MGNVSDVKPRTTVHKYIKSFERQQLQYRTKIFHVSMSFQINWDSLAADSELKEKIRLFLHEELNSISLPSFIDNLTVTDFSLGNSAPEITIRHIGDPFEEFYGDHNSDDEEKKHPAPQSPSLYDSSDSEDAPEENMSQFPELPKKAPSATADMSSMVSNLEPLSLNTQSLESPVARLRKGSDLIRHFSNYNMNNLGLGPPELDLPASILPHTAAYRLHGPKNKTTERSINDIQFILEVDFQSQICMELTINLLVNYPLSHFISLPIKLKVTDLAIHALVAVAYLENKVFVSILCDLNDSAADYFTPSKNVPISRDSGSSSQLTPAGGNFVDYLAGSTHERIDVIRNINIDTEIGEVENNVLRNVGKVEKFLVEQLRNIIRDEICWPGWLCFDLNEEEE